MIRSLRRLCAPVVVLALAGGGLAVAVPSAASGAVGVPGAVAGALRPSTSSASHSFSHARAYPARLLVYAQEYSLQPSRPSVPAGKVVVQLWNRGMDPHDLRIRHVRAGGGMYGAVDGAVRITRPGTVSTATWTLKAGRYEMYCSLPGHLAMGMHVLLRVTRG